MKWKLHKSKLARRFADRPYLKPNVSKLHESELSGLFAKSSPSLIALIMTFLAALVMLCSVSCSHSINSRNVTVQIPKHPWETEKSFCYTLRWTDGREIRTKQIDSDTREVPLNLPLGQTILITATPQDDLEPFGIGIVPTDTKSTFVLNQNDGILAKMLMDQSDFVRSRINFELLSQVCNEKNEDFRRIDADNLLYAVLDGSLKKSSVKLNKLYSVPSFGAADGNWISENVSDEYLTVSDGKTPTLKLPHGIHRYINEAMNTQISIFVDSGGNYDVAVRPYTIR